MTYDSAQLAQAYQNACLEEIEALKPGNVHIYADGHDMVVQDFIRSAEVSSKTIALPNLSLGVRIYHSVDATWQTVGCNTNLGIVLLCAPLVQAALMQNKYSLTDNLTQVLATTTIEDAQKVFEAIQLVKPAGLGHSDQYDVRDQAHCTLLQAMEVAERRDMVARQYSNGFDQVLHEALPCYQQALLAWERPAWAATAMYLYWLSHYPDSHVQRKYGEEAAQQLQDEAIVHAEAYAKHANPKQYLPQLMQFDQDLKARGINPGTSADLTVATLLLHRIII
ncbi:MAG: triphosphoribosyl-dephospho-CoA synthase [Methylophilus sp.]|nr:triphosphoribosyl-dephospho-CoA synthase [Methylophilus sp.]